MPDDHLTRRLRDALGLQGYRVLDGGVVGRSGVTHTFDILAVKGEERIGFDVVDGLDELRLLACYLKQMDTGLTLTIISRRQPSPRLQRLAEHYSINIVHEEAFHLPATASQPRERVAAQA